MSPKINNSISTTVSLWLWGAAIIAILLVVGALGWQLFYGVVIPQSNSVATLPLISIIGFSAVAGILSFFAPCPFAVFPAYAAFFLAEDDNHAGSRKKAFRFALSASLGIISFYILLGIVLASLGTQLAIYTNHLKFGVVVLIFIFGWILLTGKQLPTGVLDSWTNRLSARFKNWGAFGYGVIYAIAGATCFLPVILTIAILPILAGKFMVGLAAFVSYGLAIAAMLTIATFILASGKQKLLQALSGKAGTIKKLSGIILIGTALFLVAFYIQTGM